MVQLSKGTMERLRTVFPSERQAEAENLLATECADNLPFHQGADENKLERIRFAVLKLSNGDLIALRQRISEAQTDWRDVLMAAGFGQSIEDHKKWKP